MGRYTLKPKIPAGESFIGLIVQSDRFVLTWPFSRANPELHSVRWTVNGQEKDYIHYGESADRSELLVPDKCVHISAELIKLSDNGTKSTIYKVDYDATDGLPVDPIVSFVDSKLRVDWSAIWPCSHVKDYMLELTGKSGRTILNTITEKTSHTLTSRTDCELAEMCVLARDEKGDVIGRRCVPDVPPHDKLPMPLLDHKDKRLVIEWILPQYCHPTVVSIIVRSKERSEIVFTKHGDSTKAEIQAPEWCTVCVIYVVAEYPYLHSEVSEPAFFSGDQTATFLKPGLVVPGETVHCSRKESIFGAKELLKYQEADTAIPSKVLSWNLEAHCPVVLYNIEYVPGDDEHPRFNVVMRDNECIIESILHHTNMQISLVKSDGHVVKSQKRLIFGSSQTRIKICTEGGHQVRVYGPYEEEPQDKQLEHDTV
ncbi:hypothetical protein FGIG_02888 [Fasciola gigantica]|uniref:Uncharacterized protein n=1 Tax=Fasciola gigantica TaxID=46835 RepID=A0A504YIQ6_FASGI|nr:hypothetical protein FGIG_02888 [Fasciola gigantica]